MVSHNDAWDEMYYKYHTLFSPILMIGDHVFLAVALPCQQAWKIFIYFSLFLVLSTGVGSVCFRHILYFTGIKAVVCSCPSCLLATMTHSDNKVFVQVWESLSSFDEQNKHDACNVVKLSGIASTAPLNKVLYNRVHQYL